MDLREFLEKEETNAYNSSVSLNWVDRERLGLFFWERGGKEFVEIHKWIFDRNNVNDGFFRFIVELANKRIKAEQGYFARDFLDCLKCFSWNEETNVFDDRAGEEKVKELIKEMK